MIILFTFHYSFTGTTIASLRYFSGIHDEPSQRLPIKHHFTVDVEEYFQVSALEPYVSRDSWDERESRVEGCVDRLLELLDRHGSKATFFVLGCIANNGYGYAGGEYLP